MIYVYEIKVNLTLFSRSTGGLFPILAAAAFTMSLSFCDPTIKIWQNKNKYVKGRKENE